MDRMQVGYVNFLSIYINSCQSDTVETGPFLEVKRVSNKHSGKDKQRNSSILANSGLQQKDSLARSRSRGLRNYSDWVIETYQPTITMSDSDAADAPATGKDSGPGKSGSGGSNKDKDDKDQSASIETGGTSTQSSEMNLEDLTTKKKESKTSVLVKCGNPLVEQVCAIIHFYKHNERVSLSSDASKPTLLCILGVPVSITLKELLGVLGSWTDLGQLREVKVLRPADSRANAYLTLLQFADNASADCFYSVANGRAYSSFDTESICNVIYVDRLEFGDDAVAHFEGLGGLARVTELPNCPVCLERLDEPVHGMLTSTLCNHIFHASCLIQWSDNNCPVCRFAQTPEIVSDHRCGECDSRESLWLCLICGNVGCGRYNEAHAEKHFRATNHSFALQVGKNRVWDYVQDKFVHRLIQNNTDGKLVEVAAPGGATSHANEEKIESLQLECTFLLNTQLESQRSFYEARLAAIEKRFSEQLTRCEDDRSVLEQEKTSFERKLAQTTSKLQSIQRELDDERQMNADLRKNQAAYVEMLKAAQARHEEDLKKKEAELAELREQANDLMANFEMAEKVRLSGLSNDELASSSLTVGETAQQNVAGTSTASARKSRRKK